MKCVDAARSWSVHLLQGNGFILIQRAHTHLTHSHTLLLCASDVSCLTFKVWRRCVLPAFQVAERKRQT